MKTWAQWLKVANEKISPVSVTYGIAFPHLLTMINFSYRNYDDFSYSTQIAHYPAYNVTTNNFSIALGSSLNAYGICIGY